MPTVAVFDGIRIEFYYNEHYPAHFHARYAEHIVQIEIERLRVMEGHIPPAQLRKVVEWAKGRRKALADTWSRCRDGLPLEKIP